jgi:hypothetical protein
MQSAILDPPDLGRKMLQNLCLLSPQNERGEHRSSSLDSLRRKECSVVGIVRSGLRLENKVHIFLNLLENSWKNESKKRRQLLKIILERRASEEKPKKGRNLDQPLISLGVDVLQHMALVINTDLFPFSMVFEHGYKITYVRLQSLQKLVVFLLRRHIICSNNDIDCIGIIENVLGHFSSLTLKTCQN